MRTILCLLVLATACWGQTTTFMPQLAPKLEYVEKLGDSHLIKIDGKNYLAVDGEKARELLAYRMLAENLKAQLDKMSETFTEFKATSEKIRASEQEKADTLLSRSQAETAFFKKQYEEEMKLRQTFEADVRKCGKPWLFGYRFCKF